MLKARIVPYRLLFNFVAVTSRESMTYKDTYFIVLEDDDRRGIGECALFRGLSCDDRPDYEAKLEQTCRELEAGHTPYLKNYPSIRFGVETALRSLDSGDTFSLFPSDWSLGKATIRINGLVWMGSADLMKKRVREKLDKGFRCIKLKIGGVDFDEELEIIRSLRKEFTPETLEIRLDANGAFSTNNALQHLERLSDFYIHSIEQPIRAGQYEDMARLCRLSPIDIALDEELIGVNDVAAKRALLRLIRPHYIILKPALVGGFSGCDEWIEAASETVTDWWATSALESDIGLNAIAQWCYTKSPKMPQGLGTGLLYSNNIPSPLIQKKDFLAIDPMSSWKLPEELL